MMDNMFNPGRPAPMHGSFGQPNAMPQNTGIVPPQMGHGMGGGFGQGQWMQNHPGFGQGFGQGQGAGGFGFGQGFGGFGGGFQPGQGFGGGGSVAQNVGMQQGFGVQPGQYGVR